VKSGMRVLALDHVNIIAGDLDAACAFYADLLGLERRDAPSPMSPQAAQWLHDGEGRAVLHINSVDCPRSFNREAASGPTGSIHHVALRCEGYDAMIERLDARQADYQSSALPSIGLRQIFVHDPNGVLIELNFFGN
jgi:catechol 2,3-dioxygenase-like lactoylglutathione lyase family enzyme